MMSCGIILLYSALSCFILHDPDQYEEKDWMPWILRHLRRRALSTPEVIPKVIGFALFFFSFFF